MLNGHVEVPHLADAEEDRYSALLKDVDVGTGWRSRVTFEMQGPIDLSCLSIGKCELGLGRNVLGRDEVFHGLAGLHASCPWIWYIRCPGSHRSDCAEV